MAERDLNAPATPVPGTRELSSSTRVLDELGRRGFGADLVPRPGGLLRCGHCGETSPADGYQEVEERRLEGASDPDDTLLVVAARCPRCGTGGSVVLGYGPGASGTDSDVVARLSRRAPGPADAGPSAV